MFDFFSARRPVTIARSSMVATSHPLSSAAGLEILAAGGKAVDAALAAVAVQCVVDPLMTGIGGDCFVLYAPNGGAPRALNGSGRAPGAATIDALRAAGLTDAIPPTSAHAVTVPGAISAWCRLHADHGTLPLEQILARAIDYGEAGFAVTPRVAQDWARNAGYLQNDRHAAGFFLPSGRAPEQAEVFRQPQLAQRMRDIAAGGAAAFYTGRTAQQFVNHLKSLGGLHTEDDFAQAADQAHWVEPIATCYRGFDVLECPPNGQGLAALIILRILEGFDLGPDLPEADRVHLHAEATKLAYEHRDRLIGDPANCDGLAEELLSDPAIDALRARIDPRRALPPALWNEPEHKDTVYLCVVDDDGNAISLINSLFHGFGSTRLDPATGVLFHSRGCSFRLDAAHPNAIAPYRRPMHTIIPAMVMKDGVPLMPFGVMGGDYQAAGHAALLSAVIDQGLDPQTAIDRPRSFAFNGQLQMEPGIAPAVRDALQRRGHAVRVVDEPIGGAQAIVIDPNTGSLHGASDSRKDGMAIGL